MVADSLDPTADFSNVNCAINVFRKSQDGKDVITGGEITIRVEGEVMRRLLTRAYKGNVADYAWDNVLKRVLENHVY